MKVELEIPDSLVDAIADRVAQQLPAPAASPITAERKRIALTRAEAAEALGMSADSFERYVQPEIRLIHRGRLRLVPVDELERWVAENAARPLDGRR